MALDDSANVYVTGGTRSTDFPSTAGALRTTYNGGKADGYVTKIKNDGSAILFSTFYGTVAYDQTYFVQIDRDGDVYVVGQTEGAMPVSPGVYNNSNSGQFIAKMNDSLNTLIFSTVFGNGNGMPNISPSAFLVDICKNIYVSGWGGNIMTGVPTTGMPLTPNAHQSITDGFNFYLFVLSANAASLLYATYFGGAQSQEHVDGGTSRFDKRGIVYQSVCAGCGGQDDFPVSPGAWPYTSPRFEPYDPSDSVLTGINMSSNCNNGVFKFDFQVPLVIADFTVNNMEGCTPLTVNFINHSSLNAPYKWNFGGGDTTSSVRNPVRTFTTPGTHKIWLYAKDTSSCNYIDSTFFYVTVYPIPSISNSSDTTICSYGILNIPLTSTIPSSYTWLATPNPNITGESSIAQISNTINDAIANNTSVIQSVIYRITPTTIAGSCIGATKTFTVSVNPTPILNLLNDTTICNTGTLNIPLSSTIPASYSWSAIDNPATTGESTNLQSMNVINDNVTNITSSIQTITYSITLSSIANGCVGASTTFSLTIHPIPTLSFNYDTTICNNGTLNISLSSNIASAYTWVAADNLNTTGESTINKISNIINDVIINNSASVQTISYSITPIAIATNCVGTVKTFTVSVIPIITANFGFTHNACIYEADFADSSKYLPAKWIWDFGDGTTDSIQNPPPHTYIIAGIYDVTLTVFSLNNCNDSIIIPVNFSDPLVAVSQESSICINEQVQLTATGGVAYSWLPTTNLDNSQIANPIASPIITTTYTVVINALTPLGDSCQRILSTTVHVFDPTLYTLSATTDTDTLMLGQSTTIHAIVSPTVTIVSWLPNQNISDVNSFNPVVTPATSTSYTVSIFDAEGCPKSATVFIYVLSNKCENSDIFVPNTFTPNGDGNNDVLYVRGNNITELYFAVYNRWGQMVFETTDLKKGWDGIYNDMKVDPVVFAWYLRARCYNEDRIEKKGNVTLIR